MYLICLFWEKLFINLKKIYNQLHWKFFLCYLNTQEIVILFQNIFPHKIFFNWRRTNKKSALINVKEWYFVPWSLIIVVRIFNGKINIWNLILMLVLESWIQKNWTFLTWFEIGWSCFGIVTYICSSL